MPLTQHIAVTLTPYLHIRLLYQFKHVMIPPGSSTLQLRTGHGAPFANAGHLSRASNTIAAFIIFGDEEEADS